MGFTTETHPGVSAEAPAATERTAWAFAQRGILELTHHRGTEGDPDFRDPDGYWIEIVEPARLTALGR